MPPKMSEEGMGRGVMEGMEEGMRQRRIEGERGEGDSYVSSF